MCDVTFIILNLSGIIKTTLFLFFFNKSETQWNFTLHFPGFCLFVGNLNSNKDFDEIKDALRKFFSKNSLEVADVRLGGSK